MYLVFLARKYAKSVNGILAAAAFCLFTHTRLFTWMDKHNEIICPHYLTCVGFYIGIPVTNGYGGTFVGVFWLDAASQR